MDYLPWTLLAAAAALFVWACRVLIADARSGACLTMGGEMYFSQLWLFGCLAGAAGATLALQASWWLYLPGVVLLYVLSFPLRRILVARNLGAEAPPPPKDGFKEFLRRTGRPDAE